ncbi:hypothetical protein N5C46_08390 [Rossellomorea vietnamensis]|uniref:Uncharacterized protein n=1 Tax=Rossellomorea vietnamensis TaxID=218284 RepID=A0ACD4CBJ4_9BACI|nr:hypothetical protein [Rossellomorea vietnamensis]UXH46049.1 hypothetical protein N5C46_08390 [Rossellomorea vietnamensis]
MKVKWLLIGLGMLVLFSLLAGCRITFTTAKEEKPRNPKNMMINASVSFKPHQIIIRGNTDLPPDSVLYIMLKPYEDTVSLEEIQTYQVEPEDIAVASTAKVEKDGSIELTILKWPDPNKRYRLDLMFIPDKQPEEIKLGENLKNNESYIEISENGKTLTGLLLYVNVFKEDETVGGTMDFILKQNTP